MAKIPALKAIRKFCLHCVSDSPKEVTNCIAGSGNSNSYQCSIYPYRSGHRPKDKIKLTPVKAIRIHCLDCNEGNYKETRNCSGRDKWGDLLSCPLLRGKSTKIKPVDGLIVNPVQIGKA